MCLVYLVPTQMSFDSGLATLPRGVDRSFLGLSNDWRSFCESLLTHAFPSESSPFPANEQVSPVVRRALVELFPQTKHLLSNDLGLSEDSSTTPARLAAPKKFLVEANHSGCQSWSSHEGPRSIPKSASRV
eukprot:Gregarina_sp_Poly_1__9502@NODE_597_length_7261_cov_402_527940_g461_i0_p7_GENE_NODE_597_length_7261_cov_402_527940_g461_i0NODE_597_length_7261_cov_402_527940_g461_i0_p7_ORF_typecomplete_len131_score14_62_NODE_597_length_7261_cov_402_527940_g461_i031093501